MSADARVLPDDEHNRALVDNVYPPGRVNPTPAGRYNLVVVGAGTAGLVSAVGAAELGARVAIIEKHLMGGDCLNVGCVPSKSLLRSAHAAHAMRGQASSDSQVGRPTDADFGAAMKRMRRVRANISQNDSVQRLQDLGIDVFLGSAAFVAPDALEVAGQRLRFSRAVVATGARAATPAIPGLEEAGFLTNETVFSLTQRPRRLLIIGAGPIGCELAQAFQRLGSEVTIIGRDPALLSREDKDAAQLLATQLQRDGVRMLLGASIQRVQVQRGGDGSTSKVVVLERENREMQVAGDEILLAVGRVPNVEGMDLDAAGVRFDEKGIAVDDRLRTSNRRIYAAGDICSVYKFTHAADAMARVVLQNALFFGRKKVSALVIPWCTYTSPEVAHVGLYEQEAIENGHRVNTLTVSLGEVDRAILDGESEGFARVHLDAKNGRILGATLVARHAGELIGEMALAMTAQLSMKDVARTILPYPTQAEAWKRLGDQWNRSRLTPSVAWLFERWLRWMR